MGPQAEQFFRNTTFLSNIFIEIILTNIHPFLSNIKSNITKPQN